MPYRSTNELPPAVKDALPEHGQKVFLAAFNAAVSDDKPEERAFAIAWAAVEAAGYHKDASGKWVAPEKSAPGIGDVHVPATEERKSDAGRPLFTFQADLTKADEDQRKVYGWLSMAELRDGTPVVDREGDVIPADELQKASHIFVKEYRSMGDRHQRTVGVGKLIESVVFTRETQKAMAHSTGGTVDLPVAWWVGFQVEDPDVWAKIKSGEYKSFSFGGSAEREPLGGPEVEPTMLPGVA